MSHEVKFAKRPPFDDLFKKLAHYTASYDVKKSALAMETARYCLFDSLGCAFLALHYPACTKILGPSVPGADFKGGVKIPGTAYELEPVMAAFNLGAMVRWLDFNDTWLAKEWGHPSDNLGAIWAVAEYVSRENLKKGLAPLTMRQVLEAMIKAHEIQGVLALENAFNRVGLDHVLLVRIASAALAMQLLGGSEEDILTVLSHAWIDGSALRTYRHAPNAGPRKSWAAGDASSRGVRLALLVNKGEIGYPSGVTAKTWGFQDALFRGETVKIEKELASYVMENVLFKISFPAEFHAQTAVECAVKLYPALQGKIEAVDRILVHTQESAIRIIDKTGPLDNPADRDHCLQYMIAIGLLRGDLTAEDYEDSAAADPRIDFLRSKMEVLEEPRMSKEYLDPNKRSIGNAVQIFYKDGSHSERVVIDYPIGHKNRRKEGIPVLENKYKKNFAGILSTKKCQQLFALGADQAALEKTSVPDFSDLCSLG